MTERNDDAPAIPAGVVPAPALPAASAGARVGAGTSEAAPELWGGPECSVIRLASGYVDQIALSGHDRRRSDLDRFAALGLRALRYPILWERTAPDGPDGADWSWADERLARLRELGVRPIVGLVHHGGGPPWTSLVDPSFADGLAVYARAVAGRYPWLRDFTPVNEPLTTARFAGLYGHWHPHGRDDRTFVAALLNQLRGVVLAMRAIREVIPGARLIQTEDLGRVWSTPALRAQADFENARRWLSFDLLCGRVGADHPLHGYLRSVGVAEGELAWFREHPCPPDILGLNYYVTSERFLDERLDRYPPRFYGGNRRRSYADVEAVRVLPGGGAGPAALLREVWGRYRLPMAVTEVHLGCTREEQMRWFREVWDAARLLRREGADLRAVTAWSLLGSFDWDSLVTQPRGRYEPGVFDVRGAEPRPTALARLIRSVGLGRELDHPTLGEPGWWRRPDRFLVPEDGARAFPTTPGIGRRRPILIVGAAGTLGRAFVRMARTRGLTFHAATRAELDITDRAAVAAFLDAYDPWAVINAAGSARIDDAERDGGVCRRANVEGAENIARACARAGRRLLGISSDQVFDGRAARPYDEASGVAPLNAFGRCHAEAERRVLEAHPDALIVRAGGLFGPWDAANFVTTALRALARGEPFLAAADAVFSPSYAPTLVDASLDLLIDDEAGLWHLACAGEASWAELARRAARGAGLDESLVRPLPLAELALPAPRPPYSALTSARGRLMPTLDEALDRYHAACERQAGESGGGRPEAAAGPTPCLARRSPAG